MEDDYIDELDKEFDENEDDLGEFLTLYSGTYC